MSLTYGVLVSGGDFGIFNGPRPNLEVGRSILNALLIGDTETFAKLCEGAGLTYLGKTISGTGKAWALCVGDGVQIELARSLGLQFNCSNPGCDTPAEPDRAWCQQHMPRLQAQSVSAVGQGSRSEPAE